MDLPCATDQPSRLKPHGSTTPCPTSTFRLGRNTSRASHASWSLTPAVEDGCLDAWRPPRGALLPRRLRSLHRKGHFPWLGRDALGENGARQTMGDGLTLALASDDLHELCPALLSGNVGKLVAAVTTGVA